MKHLSPGRTSGTLCASILILLLIAFFALPSSTLGQEGNPPAALEVTQRADGVHIFWQLPPEADPPQTLADGWRWSELGGYLLPFSTITVNLPQTESGEAAFLQPDIIRLETEPWLEPLRPAPQPTMRAADGSVLPNPPAEFEVSGAPLYVLRSGRYRDGNVAVVALSPIFAQPAQTGSEDGEKEVFAATVLEAMLPGVTLADEDAVIALAEAEETGAQPISPLDNESSTAAEVVASDVQVTATSAPIATIATIAQPQSPLDSPQADDAEPAYPAPGTAFENGTRIASGEPASFSVDRLLSPLWIGVIVSLLLLLGSFYIWARPRSE